MSDVNDFAEQDDGVLADTDSDISATDDVSQSAEPAQEEPQEKAPQYLTRDEFERMWQEREGDVIRRASQSATDRVSSRINERFQALEQNAKTLGLSDEQLEKAKERVYREEITRRPDDAATSSTNVQGAGSQGQQPQQVNIVDTMLQSAFQVGGAEVAPTDPEAKHITAAMNDPKATPATLQAAALKASMEKAARVAKASKNDRISQPTGGGGQPAKTKERLLQELTSLQAKKATPENLKRRAKVLEALKQYD